MAFNPLDLLGYVYLTDTVQVVAPGIPKLVPEQFFTIKETVLADKARYVETYGQRRLARRVPYGSPGRQVQKTDLAQRDLQLVNYREEMLFDQELFNVFRQWSKYEPQQKFAKDQLTYQGENFRQRFENTRIASLLSFLATGKNYFDADGYVLATSSGADATKTIEQGIPVANTGTITDGSGFIVTASWATASTNIITQINNLKALSTRTTGYAPKYAFYGKNVAGYVGQNASCQAYFSYNTAQGNQYTMSGVIPKGFCDLEWIPVQNAFFDTEAGVPTEIFPADQVTFFPELSKSTYTLFEGTTLVPSSLGIFTDPQAAWANLKEVVGMGRFTTMMNAMQIIDNAFDVFLPRFKVPKSVYMMDTTP